MSEMNETEYLYPHSPDVAERETSDGGFSSGWGMHFMPTASGIADVHGHIQFESFGDAEGIVKRHMDLVRPLGVTHSVACTPIMSTPQYACERQGFSVPCLSGRSALAPYFDVARKSHVLALMLFLHYANPDLELLKWSAAQGACAVKLHNAPLIVNAADPEIWFSGQWSEAFAEMERLGLPVLWHVTQRLAGCPYTGGGRNTYWKDGWVKGVKYTNEDLLQIYLKTVRKYPGIPFISAHQLHLGWDRLAVLFDEYPNLYIDTSVGCFVREGDRMYEHDIRTIRDFFIRYSGRILFGTDYFITDGSTEFDDGEKKAIIQGHIRFIRQLRLPSDTLDSVFQGNAARLLRLD